MAPGPVRKLPGIACRAIRNCVPGDRELRGPASGIRIRNCVAYGKEKGNALITCTRKALMTYSASDQVVSEHGPVEKVLRFSSLEPRSAHPETALFRTFQRRSMGQIAEVAKNPTFWGPVRP